MIAKQCSGVATEFCVNGTLSQRGEYAHQKLVLGEDVGTWPDISESIESQHQPPVPLESSCG